MIIRNMDHQDIEFAFQCTSSEGWQGETREVFEGFRAYNPKGCFVAEVNSHKIGIGVAVAYRNNGFIGELIVIRDMRGRGYGSRLFEHMLQYFRSLGIKNIYLDADPDAVSLYERYGFKKVTRTLRYRGKIKGNIDPSVLKMSTEDLDDICKIDKQLFADDRTFFLKRRLRLFPDLCLVAKKDNKITGYVFGRPGVNVMSVAPLAVLDENPDTARVLIEYLAGQTQNDKYAGVLENNSKAVIVFRSFKSLKMLTPGWYMANGVGTDLGTNSKLYSIGSAAKG